MKKNNENIIDYSQVEDFFYQNKFKHEKSKYSDVLSIMMDDISNFEKLKKETQSPSIRIINDFSTGVIDISTLTSVANGLQKVFNGAYNAIRGNGSNKGKIPRHIQDESMLVITGFAKGSFIIKLDSAEKELNKGKEKLFDSNFNQIELLNDIIVSINKVDSYADLSSFVEKFGVRTFNYTRDWFKQLAYKDIALEFNNKPYNIDTYFNKSRISDIAERFSTIDLKEAIEKVKFTGKLTGVNHHNSTIELNLESDNLIKIKIIDDSLEYTKLTTNLVYNLDVNKIEINDSLGKSSIIYEMPTVKGTELERP